MIYSGKVTRGGRKGHVLRRLIHVATLFLPFLYYSFASSVPQWFYISAKQLVLIILLLNAGLEIIRLKFKWVLFGQRLHEATHISSFTWGLTAIGLVLLFAPGKEFGIPLIVTCAIVDPFLGELRDVCTFSCRIILGIVVVFVIWGLASFYLGTPVKIAFWMAPLVILLEWPKLKWVDDNALMQLVPLGIIIMLYG